MPIDFRRWIQDNGELLQPPVSNFCLYSGNDFIVMAVGGPNSRTDFHINETEEWFYQHKGDMLLKTVQEGVFVDVPIREGEMFLLAGGTPHNPVRFADTVGIVVERTRPAGALDRLRWYCEQCKKVVYEEAFHCTDLGSQLKPVIEKYFADDALRTCSYCKHVNGIAD